MTTLSSAQPTEQTSRTSSNSVIPIIGALAGGAFVSVIVLFIFIITYIRCKKQRVEISENSTVIVNPPQSTSAQFSVNDNPSYDRVYLQDITPTPTPGDPQFPLGTSMNITKLSQNVDSEDNSYESPFNINSNVLDPNSPCSSNTESADSYDMVNQPSNSPIYYTIN